LRGAPSLLSRISLVWIGRCGLPRWTPIEPVRGLLPSSNAFCKERRPCLICFRGTRFPNIRRATYERECLTTTSPIGQQNRTRETGGCSSTNVRTFPPSHSRASLHRRTCRDHS